MHRSADIVETDVVVVGLGATGAIAAYVLANRGLSVTGIEAGPFLRTEEFVQDELASCLFDGQLGPKFMSERPLWTQGSDQRNAVATPSPIGTMVNAVGGSSNHFAGWSRRFQQEDFRSRSSTIARYGEARLPRDCTLVDWPFSYEDLEPYYTQVEELLGISGRASHVRGRPSCPDGNPFEAERSHDYPLPPLRSFPFGEMFANAARGMGYHPYRVPAAILSRDFDGRPACRYCGWCLGQACPYGSKSSTLVTAVPKAMELGRLQVRDQVRALRVVVEGDRAIGIECTDATGRELTVAARYVLLAAYTFENVRLLFLSRSRGHETGLGNEHGQLGKNFMCRQAVEVFGCFPGRSLELSSGPAGQATCFDDLNGDNFDHAGLGFVRGGTVSVESEMTPIRAARNVPPWVPRWGAGYKSFIRQHWDSLGCVRAMPEPLPYDGNEIVIDWHSQEATRRGLPRLRVEHQVRENERRLGRFLESRMSELLRRMGAAAVYPVDLGVHVLSGHDVGGARMGHDPTTSVVDEFGRVHEAENVYVLGGATFPTATGINPTLTIQALAWRTADHVADGGS